MYKKKSRSRWNQKAILWITVLFSALMTVTILLPGLIAKKIQPHHSIPGAVTDSMEANASTSNSIMIPVYLTQKKQIETVSLEAYVRGVLAAEMPIEFEPEALKAQAMASRTYMVRRILDQDFSNVPVKNAWVTDTVAQQAYISLEDLKSKWGSSSSANMDKINRAVKETEGMILTYENRPINATFFSTSNGYTENSEDYWPDKIPYLRSVLSPWDIKLSPSYQSIVTLGYKSVLQKLGVSGISTVSTRSNGIKILEWSAGHRVKKITIGGKIFSGREVREKLGLASSQFDWKWKGSELEFITYGYGHGVGLSQWGANGMAKEGKTCEEIVRYYYTGISIGKASSFLPNR
jgi:stage II sporulation protein D